MDDFQLAEAVVRIVTFRVPSLPNRALSTPYMHNGSLAALEDVVQFYADGGGRKFGNETVDSFVLFIRSDLLNPRRPRSIPGILAAPPARFVKAAPIGYTTCTSGSSAARQRASFGTKRSEVQILSPRHRVKEAGDFRPLLLFLSMTVALPPAPPHPRRGFWPPFQQPCAASPHLLPFGQ